MTADHSSYEEIAAPRRGSQEYREGYAEARRAFLIGQAVRERRLALGMSQVELAARAGMTQSARPGWKLAGSWLRSHHWNGLVRPSTLISSWRSLLTLPDSAVRACDRLRPVGRLNSEGRRTRRSAQRGPRAG